MAGLWGAIMTGVNAAITAYNQRSLVPQLEFGWDTYQSRLQRYATYTGYLNNTIYSAVNSQSSALKLRNRLYTNTRGIYNPVARQNQLLIGYVYGGAIDMEHITGGAIPIVTDNDRIKDGIRQLFDWSRWGENKSLLVRYGASLGDMAIKLVDDRERGKVRMEVLDPGRIRDVQMDEVGNVKGIVIEYMRTEENDLTKVLPQPGIAGQIRESMAQNQWYTYTEIITKDKFSTYKNGKPFAYYNDMNGTAVSEWDNEYGFVPVVVGQHAPSGLNWGINSFYNTLDKINEINDAASLVNDQIRKAVVPIFAAVGVKKPTKTSTGDLEIVADNRDQIPIMYLPVGGSIAPLETKLDIAHALQNIQQMQEELERDLPELALQKIRERGQLTAPGVNAAYSDAVGRIKEARGNYDHTTVRALQMGISMAGYNGYDGFAGFNLDSYDAGDLDFSIKDRAIIADTLSVSERITFLASIGTMTPSVQELALKEMDYSDEQIAKVTSETEAAAQNAIDQFAKSAFGGGTDNQDTAPNKIGAPQDAPKQMMLPAMAGA